MSLVQPHIGQWYFCRDTGLLFEVVSTDAVDKTIELQDADGNLDEIDYAGWYALNLEAVEPPGDLNAFDTPLANEAGAESDFDGARYERSALMQEAQQNDSLGYSAEDRDS
jgi:hypothetical protein